jgi:8-oxo-dGTP diphosphatase
MGGTETEDEDETGTENEREPPTMTFAAGGLLWRAAGDDPTDAGEVRRLVVVHRPRYDDWSLPKGKVEPGELLPETAVREVREETGFSVRREGFAGRYQYAVSAGPKTVFVWHMHAVDDVGRSDDEVDALAWLTPAEALDRLTYDLERGLLRRVVDADSA